MAGDWLKMEAATPDKPEVLAITVSMGWDDPDTTVGKLFRVWRWFDQHTTDGNARGVTTALLDRISGVTGFALAMAAVGWLAVGESGVSLPNFDRHCGKSAKDRAQTAKRVANHKSNGKGNADGNAPSVTDALPREEKRREEKNQEQDAAPTLVLGEKPVDPKPKAPPKTDAAIGSRLPDDWQPDADLLEWAKAERPDVNVTKETENFRDYWHAKAGADARKVSWPLTFKTWIKRAHALSGRVNQPQSIGSRAASRPLE